MNRYKKGSTHQNMLTQLWTYEYMVNKLNLKENDSILDVGCADGVLSRFISNRRLSGIDINKTSLPEKYTNLILCDIEKNIPLENNSYDVSIAVSVFQYFDNPYKAFENILRVSRKKVVIFDANYDRIFLKNTEKLFPITKFSMQHLAEVYRLKLNLIYVSNKFNFIRKIIPKYLAGGIIAIFEKK